VPYVNLDGFSFDTVVLASFVSADGGKTASASFLISQSEFHQPNSSCPQLAGRAIRADLPLPSAQLDGSGKIYAVWADCRFEPQCNTGDLVLSTSTDGQAWSAVRRIPISPVGSTEDVFLPGLGVDRSTSGNGARLGLVYNYYTNGNCDGIANNCDLNVGFVSSTNGGRTWSTQEQIAGPMKLTWLPNTSQGFMTGDYFATAIVNGSDDAFPAFAVAQSPSGSVLDEFMATTANENLRLRGGDQPSGEEGSTATRLLSCSPPSAAAGGELPQRQPTLRQHKTY
jgi:hypothetical protein